MVWFGLLTGMRIGEILGLPWKDVDFASGQIRVNQAYYRGTLGSPKTKHSKRSVPLPEVLEPVLLQLRRKAANAEQLVFNGTPYNDTLSLQLETEKLEDENVEESDLTQLIDLADHDVEVTEITVSDS